MAVLVLDKRKKPLMPCSEKRARLLLSRGRARVHRRHPFTIRLVDRVQATSAVQPMVVKTDPGSQATGIALVREAVDGTQVTHHVAVLIEVQHRGRAITEALTARRAFRRRRRGQTLRYRAPRFDNRTRPEGWLAPSLRHRMETTASWIERLRRFAPVTRLAVEQVRFDMQAMQDPEISGVEYQQGALQGYEVREYLLEKWGRTCAYCDAKQVPLEAEHIVPRSRGGSGRVSNLTLACVPCNRAKGALPVEQFVRDPARLARVLSRAKAPLRAAAAVNATRNAIVLALAATGLGVETATGGRTKWNRSRLGLPKTHALDGACAGEVDAVEGWQVPTLAVKAMGRGRYQRARLDRFGFPRGHSLRQKQVRGFATGDLVRAEVPSGKNAGVHVGRVAIRASGSFNVQTSAGVVQGVGFRHCRLLQRRDGYGYASRGAPAAPCAPPPPEGRGFRTGEIR